jgi:hypothetical protein
MTTKYDPSSDDVRILAALAAREQLDGAFATQDNDAFNALTASDLLVHAPNDTVLQCEAVRSAFRSGRMNYSGGKATNIEFAAVRGEWVVLMGEEVIKPIPPAANAGKTLRRRFTDLWREYDGTWRLSVRQATIVQIST